MTGPVTTATTPQVHNGPMSSSNLPNDIETASGIRRKSANNNINSSGSSVNVNAGANAVDGKSTNSVSMSGEMGKGRRGSRSSSLQLQRRHQRAEEQEGISDGDELVDSESERADIDQRLRNKIQPKSSLAASTSNASALSASVTADTPSSASNTSSTATTKNPLQRGASGSLPSAPSSVPLASTNAPSAASATSSVAASMPTSASSSAAPTKPGRGRPRGRGRGAGKPITDGRSPIQTQTPTYPPSHTASTQQSGNPLVGGPLPASRSTDRIMTSKPPLASSSASQSFSTAPDRGNAITSHPRAPPSRETFYPSQQPPISPPPASSSISRDRFGTSKLEKYPPPFRPQPPGGVIPPSMQSNVSDHAHTKAAATGHHPSTQKPESISKSKSSLVEDLTLPEVDKFMDLIEKHNLHTSNEDDMARSVTELYQEWLEWCAKRNVQSTKSKQALVAEFVRIHQGDYGHVRQQRAVDIVKGSAVDDQEDDDLNPGSMKDRPRRGSALLQPSSLPNAHSPSTTSVPLYKEDDRDSTMHDRPTATNPAIRRADLTSKTAPTPSPATAIKSLPSAGVLESAQTTSNTQRESLYWQVRDDVWREASAMITRVIQDQIGDLVTENTSLRGRVEQLEIHSDNLAQWIQHLNRVQDDLSQSLAATPPSRILREEVSMEESTHKYGAPPPHSSIVHSSSRSAVPHGHERVYQPSYTGPSSAHSSPKRSYVIHRSPSPPPSMRHTGYPPASHSAPIVYREGSRESYSYNTGPTAGGSSGGGPSQYSHRVSSTEHYDRQPPYYSYPPDARDRLPPASSPHHHHATVKRPRNGY